jgi:hypothetical protein
MRFMRTIKPRSVARNAAVIVAAIALSATAAAAQRPRGTGHGASGIHRGAHIHRGQARGAMGAPFFNQAPITPPPTFNQSSPYTVPQAPETPVSPASPGSVFGNGP